MGRDQYGLFVRAMAHVSALRAFVAETYVRLFNRLQIYDAFVKSLPIGKRGVES